LIPLNDLAIGAGTENARICTDATTGIGIGTMDEIGTGTVDTNEIAGTTGKETVEGIDQTILATEIGIDETTLLTG
jgi:hypothetical protein